MTRIFLFTMLLSVVAMQAQIRTVNSPINGNAANGSGFIDGSSNNTVNLSTNIGKGLIFPRTNLTAFTAFSGVPVGLPASYPTRFDGMMVYNTATSGVAGVGATQGTLSEGYWFYDNKSATVNGGTWRRLGGDASTIKSKTVTAIVPANATTATLALGTGTILANEVSTFLGAKIYDSTNNLVMTADSAYAKDTNLLTTGNGMMYQVLAAGTYTVVVDYK